MPGCFRFLSLKYKWKKSFSKKEVKVRRKKMPYTPSGFFCDRLIRERERRDGEGSLNKPLRFNGQDFNTLRQECLQKKSLFEDDSFPATVESLGFKELGHKSNKVKNIVWKRPKVRGSSWVRVLEVC